ncbi:hypothetical protein NPIL_460061 [Nephila pilipes]|uniref:Uncharacterized protein n=1 Tax=Nephila pilipes TaxID=299642 RepID=A0A8X6PFQ2_NEPPI|nr:hypothetical protein NPIL_460061 [Nephila pilipes]
MCSDDKVQFLLWQGNPQMHRSSQVGIFLCSWELCSMGFSWLCRSSEESWGGRAPKENPSLCGTKVRNVACVEKSPSAKKEQKRTFYKKLVVFVKSRNYSNQKTLCLLRA